MASDPDLSSSEQSEQEREDREEEPSSEDARGDHVYQTLDRPEKSLVTEPVYALPHKQPKVRFYVVILDLLLFGGKRSSTNILPLKGCFRAFQKTSSHPRTRGDDLPVPPSCIHKWKLLN